MAIILPRTGRDSALHVAQVLCDTIARLGIEHRASGTGFVTCSIGVAVSSAGSRRDASTLFADTDAALYRAKDAGRNRVRG